MPEVVLEIADVVENVEEAFEEDTEHIAADKPQAEIREVVQVWRKTLLGFYTRC